MQGNPFDVDSQQLVMNDEDVHRYSFSGLKMAENSPVLCTTGMNLLKVASRYLELTIILTPISFEVFESMTQLFEVFVRII